MKKILFAALAATMLFASCDKENGVDTPAVKGQKATLTVGIAGAGTKSVVETLPGVTMTVENYFVVVTDGASILATGYSDSSAALTLDGDDGVTTAASKVYVVANVGENFFSAADLVTESTFKSKLHTEHTNGVIASGEGDVEMVTDDPTVLKAEVGLTFVKARITLSLTLKNKDNSTYTYDPDSELILTHVAVLKAIGTSAFFGTSLYNNAAEAVFNGITYDDTDSKIAPTVAQAEYVDEFAADKKYVYYVCENENITDAATILTVVGKWNGEYRYYPVHFTASDALKLLSPQQIVRGKSYDIAMTLKGNWNPGGGGEGGEGGGTGEGEGELPGGGGTDTPDEELLPATIEITVTTTDWVPQTINKEF